MSNSNTRANALAERLLSGAKTLAAFVEGLTDSEWNQPVAGDGRTIGVVVHHVANLYPLEIELAQVLASGKPIVDATKEVVDQMNAEHAIEFANVSKQEAISLLLRNSKAAADSIRAFTETEMDQSATVSLNANAPLTAQFFIEDHALRHSFHHLDKIKRTIEKQA